MEVTISPEGMKRLEEITLAAYHNLLIEATEQLNQLLTAGVEEIKLKILAAHLNLSEQAAAAGVDVVHGAPREEELKPFHDHNWGGSRRTLGILALLFAFFFSTPVIAQQTPQPLGQYQSWYTYETWQTGPLGLFWWRTRHTYQVPYAPPQQPVPAPQSQGPLLQSPTKSMVFPVYPPLERHTP